MRQRLRPMLALLLVVTSAGLRAETVLHLEYAASLASAPVGEVVLRLRLADDVPGQAGRYHIEGEARSVGVWEAFQRWRAEFSASGAIEAGAPAPEHYRLLQHTPRKRRDVRVAEGTLFETKNDTVRAPRPTLPGLDVLAAFFVRPDCRAVAAGLDVHTGRYPYHLTLREGVPQEGGDDCLLDLQDVEDDDRYRLRLQLTALHGVAVPRALTVRVPFAARLLLRDWRLVSSSDADANGSIERRGGAE